MSIPTLYVRVVECVMRGTYRVDNCSSFVRLSAPKLRLDGRKVDCKRDPTNKAVVHYPDEFFLYAAPEMDRLEIRIMLCEPEKGDTSFGVCSLDVASLADHAARETWMPVQSLLQSARTLPSLPSIKSPRKMQGDAAPKDAQASEVHLLVYLAQASEESVYRSKLELAEYQELIKVLAEPPFDVGIQVCALAPQAAGDRLAADLVTVMHHSGAVLAFLRAIVQQEVSTTSTCTVLFRANSMAIRVLSAYGRVMGQHYLKAVLGDLLQEVCKDDASYEPDPQCVPADQAAANSKHIAEMAERFLSKILDSKDQVPVSFRIICNDLRRIVGEKWSDFWPRAVGGFFFLRFVCPVIASPMTTGLVSGMPSKNARRALILITKVLQNVANQTSFNEPWMADSEKCVQLYIPLVEKFLEDISQLDEATSASAEQAVKGEELAVAPSATAVVQAVGGIKELVTYPVESEAFMESLKRTSKPVKPYSHTGLEEKAKLQGGLVLETQSSNRAYWDESKWVLNHFVSLSLPPVDGDKIAFDLASAATQLVLSQLEKDAERGMFEEGHFVDWSAFRANARFMAFERNLSDLQQVKLETLPLEGRLVFWINVYNACMFHLFVATDGKPGRATTEGNYAVGGHLFSLDEMGYGILRGNTIKGRGMRKNLYFKSDDPRRHFALMLDSKVNFCLVTFSWDSPVLRPYDPSDHNTLRRAAAVYCEKFLQTDLMKIEVVIPKLLEDNKWDWTEEDTTQRVLQLVQFVTARKMDILQTLTNPKCSITVSKNKGQSHPIYWLGQMRVDSKELQAASGASSSGDNKLLGAVKQPARRLTLKREELASLSSVVNQAAGGTSPRNSSPPGDSSSPVSPRRSSSPRSSSPPGETAPVSPGRSGGWQRAATRSSPAIASLPKGGTKMRFGREPRARTGEGETPIDPDAKGRRSPRSPRQAFRSFLSGALGGSSSGSAERNSGFEDTSPRPGNGNNAKSTDASAPTQTDGGDTDKTSAATNEEGGEDEGEEERDARNTSPGAPGDAENCTESPKAQNSEAADDFASDNGQKPVSMSTGSLPQIKPKNSITGSPSGELPRVPPKPTSSPPRSPPRSPRSRKSPAPDDVTQVPTGPLEPSPRSAKKSPRQDSPRTTVMISAEPVADEIRKMLERMLIDAGSLLEFDVAIRTGKVLMNLRKMLMTFLGWNEMPTDTVIQVPDITLTKLQERFLPDAKHSMYVKLVQAFHSAVEDVDKILDEIMYVTPGDDSEMAKWKNREPELLALLQECQTLLQEHDQTLKTSLAKEDEFIQVMELGELLQPEIVEILTSLAKADEVLKAGEMDPALAVRLTRAKVVLETGEDPKTVEKAEAASELVPQLLGKFSSINDVMRSVNATSNGLMMLSGRVRLVNSILKEQ